MTRGKHANRAALRRESGEVQAELDRLLHRAEQAEAEADRLKLESVARMTEHQKEIHRLAAEVATGVTPTVQRLEAELAEVRTALAEQTIKTEQREKSMRSLVDALHVRLKGDGLSGLEAFEVILRLLPDAAKPILTEDYNIAKRVSNEHLVAIQQARGQRTRPREELTSIVESLKGPVEE